MHESDFVPELKRSAEHIGAWWHKMPDVSRGELEQQTQKPGRRVVLRRPYDAFFLCGPEPRPLYVALEVKVVRPGDRLVLDPHQEQNLLAAVHRGHRAYVVVRVEDVKIPRRVYVVDVRDYVGYLKMTGLKGVLRRDIATVGVELQRVRVGETRDGSAEYAWDFHPLVQAVEVQGRLEPVR